MPDARLNPESPPSPEHTAVYRVDYRPPDWLVPEVALRFTLGIEQTRVQAKLTVERNRQGSRDDAPLLLNGDELVPLGVWIDGALSNDWTVTDGILRIPLAGNGHEVAIDTEINPSANSKLMGLYASNGLLCTQCEAEGFRRIAFHPDRPDVLSRYRVRMEADRALYPVLLANGNCVAAGANDDGTHWAEWDDPFPKPSYLFAMVAGDLAPNRDSFTTMSGRTVDLAIWVREADLPRTAFAMRSLKQAMAWDEHEYGREYDLDQFNIVAVDDFNFGAMENKGLNIFNSRYVLADTATATDADIDAVAGVVAHEYFHNWSGNRVTCRDWFQLSLKEGFTVFRDQSFSADIGSAAVKRIDDVRLLRAVQFPEDSGPLAHPVRPDSYMEITNFYTATVYNKGAELIRMMRTILGEKQFRAGSDLYFDRHDGQAVTCEDFVQAMEDASGIDLSRFRLWYEQAGTPQVTARVEHDAAAGTATLHLTQSIPPTPGQDDKRPMPIPLRTALLGADSGAEIATERLVLLDEAEMSLPFHGIDEPPLLSINRGYSAPVNIVADRRPGELERLAASDSDPFARYEAMQELMLRVLIAGANGQSVDPEPVIASIRGTLASNALDAAFKGEALSMPSESLIGDRLDSVDPDKIHAARDALRAAVGRALAGELGEVQGAKAAGSDLSPQAKGVRRLKTVALALLAAGDPEAGAALARAQYDDADNMTDRQGALGVLVSLDAPQRTEVLADFYDRYRNDTLVIDKWFGLQAAAQRADTIDQVRRLVAHPDFTLANPNRARALIGSFAMNQWAFHRQGGEGYRFLADMILAIDKLNPQVAARLVPPLGRWRRFAGDRSGQMRIELERILKARGLSKDVYEQVSKSLA